MIKCHTKVPGTEKVRARFPSHPSLRVNFRKTVCVCEMQLDTEQGKNTAKLHLTQCNPKRQGKPCQ